MQRFGDRDEFGEFGGGGGGGGSGSSNIFEVQKLARKNRIENLFDYAMEAFQPLFPYQVIEPSGVSFCFEDVQNHQLGVLKILVGESSKKKGLRVSVTSANLATFITGQPSNPVEAVRSIFKILDGAPDEVLSFAILKSVSDIALAADALGQARSTLIRAHPDDFMSP
jgi:hypothetical protein